MVAKKRTAGTASGSTVEFIDGWPPPLEAGNYKIQVDQKVSVATESLSSEFKFSVGAPRFTLDPALIHSFFPPAAHQANFSEYLPQVIFTRKTLPWERTIDGSALTRPLDGSGAGPPLMPPWMGVLLFDEEDSLNGASGIPKVESKTVGDLISRAHGGSRPKGVFGPEIEVENLEAGQHLTDQCMIIEVGSELFQSIAPSLDDLPYLAHSRKVDPALKTSPGTINDDGWVSVVIGNRFPRPGKPGGKAAKNTAFLVSLEGFSEYLNGGKPITEKTTYLACLASWTFNDIGTNASFDQLMTGLRKELETQEYDGKLSGRLGLLPTQPPATTGPEHAVQQGLLQGFTAINHVTRQGEKTVSWNRGPLVPLQLAPPDQPPLYNSSDGALRYDPASGLFDVSYAAAWQLGRLLGLNNKKFSTALLNWRRATHQSTAAALTRHLCHRQLSGLLDSDGDILDEQYLKNGLLGFLATRMLETLAPADASKPGVLGKLGDPSGVRERGLDDDRLRDIVEGSDDPARDLLEWLQQRKRD